MNLVAAVIILGIIEVVLFVLIILGRVQMWNETSELWQASRTAFTKIGEANASIGFIVRNELSNQKPLDTGSMSVSIPLIARMWGVTSLDAVRDILKANGYPGGNVTMRELDIIERRLLMPDAVAREFERLQSL